MRTFQLAYPKWDDVRWVLLACQTGFVIYSLTFPGFTRNGAQLLAALAGALITDILFLYFKKVPIVPLSGLLHTAGILLLVDSQWAWIYAFVAVVSVLSKHLIRIRTRHVFNPNNFGIVVGVLFLGEYMTTTVGRWGGSWLTAAVIGALGVYIATRARRIWMSLAFLVTFFLGAIVRHWLLGAPLHILLGPLTGAGIYLFTFFVATDPVVTPKAWRHQLVFGLALGAVDAAFRFYAIKYAPFFSLVIVCGVYSFIEEALRIERDYPWSLGTVTVKPRISRLFQG